jgi:hypothetical protein
MTQLFERAVILTVGQEPPTGDFSKQVPDAIQVKDLRVAFRIEKSLKKEPQKAQISVWNLATKSRGQLAGKGLRVALEAGYKGSIALLYVGHTRTIDHHKASVDWITKLECGTNERQIQFGTVSESFKPGAKISEVAEKAAGKLVNDLGNLGKQMAGIKDTFASGYAMHGSAADELDRVLSPRGYSWSIQDGRMQILKLNETIQEEEIELTSETGLIGTPELGSPIAKGGPSVVKMRSLLQGRIRCGGRINLKSVVRSGLHKVIAVTHTGDTFGGAWETEIEAFPIQEG